LSAASRPKWSFVSHEPLGGWPQPRLRPITPPHRVSEGFASHCNGQTSSRLLRIVCQGWNVSVGIGKTPPLVAVPTQTMGSSFVFTSSSTRATKTEISHERRHGAPLKQRVQAGRRRVRGERRVILKRHGFPDDANPHQALSVATLTLNSSSMTRMSLSSRNAHRQKHCRLPEAAQK